MNISSFLFLLPVSAFLFFGCGEKVADKKSDSFPAETVSIDSSKVKTVLSAPRKIEENGIACFFVMNDKNAGTPDPQKLAEWIEPFLDSLNGEDILGNENLFNNGGGPMGAQMNPNADLLFTAFFKGDVDTASLDFKMNDYPVLKKMMVVNKKSKDGITVCWFLVPKNRFTVMLHLPSEKEKAEICTIKNLQENTWIKNSGTVMKISADAKVDGKQTSLVNYLLVSFTQ
jgi:hypothetical protein